MKSQPTIKITRKGNPKGPSIKITRAPQQILRRSKFSTGALVMNKNKNSVRAKKGKKK